MALDNYNRIKSLNDVVEAWTHFGSLPFITNKYIAAGGSVTFDISHPFRGVLMCSGMSANVTGMYIINVNNAGSAALIKAVSAASDMSVTFTPTQLTVASSGTSTTCFIMALQGSLEEV